MPQKYIVRHGYTFFGKREDEVYEGGKVLTLSDEDVKGQTHKVDLYSNVGGEKPVRVDKPKPEPKPEPEPKPHEPGERRSIESPPIDRAIRKPGTKKAGTRKPGARKTKKPDETV